MNKKDKNVRYMIELLIFIAFLICFPKILEFALMCIIATLIVLIISGRGKND